jgi:hypothetical protein
VIEPVNEPIEWIGVIVAVGMVVLIVAFIRYWHRSDEQHRKVYRLLHGRDRPW